MDHNDLYLFSVEQFNELRNEIYKKNNNELYYSSIKKLMSLRLQYQKESSIYFLLSLTYFKNKEYFKAITNFKIGLKYHINKDEYLSLIGNCLLYINDIENAYNYALRAYLENEYDIDSLILLGKIEFQKYNYEEALYYIMKALECDEQNYEVLRILSKIYISMGMNEQEVLKVLYKARKFGKDEDLNLDIIKFLYLNKQYIDCLEECKNIVSNCESGYVVEKANKYVAKIYEIICEKEKCIPKIYSSSNIIEKISKYIETGRIIKDNNFKDLYEHEKEDFLTEIRLEMRKVDNLDKFNNLKYDNEAKTKEILNFIS